ncbi:MAG: tRNA lysidine(34) synthetase TilS [Chlamydiota bacterium]
MAICMRHGAVQYHKGVNGLAQRVCRYVREQGLLRAGERVGVAVSGGADSVALLRLLLELRDELGLVLSVVHVNHHIRGAEADADQEFVTELARRHGLLLHTSSFDTPAYSVGHKLSLEAAARQLRYEYFQRLLTEGTLDKLATAHTLDDQAETVLLRLARGTGITGLAGIYPKWLVASGQRSEGTRKPRVGERSSPPEAAIIRPLLPIRRRELEAYLRSLDQPWREDATNLDPQFARNRVRHRVLPLLERELNPRIRELLAETAAIARAEEGYWAAEVSHVLARDWVAPAEGSLGHLPIAALRRHPLALQRRLLRAAAESLGLLLEFQHVEEALTLAQAPPGSEKKLLLPGGWRMRRLRDRLSFEPPRESEPVRNQSFTYSLPLPGQVLVPETGTVFQAVLGRISAEQAGNAYDPACLSSPLQVRNWHPGDRFWPSHTRAPRKVKELLQERKVTLARRRTWPVITSAVSGREQIIWMRGFPPPQALLVASGQGQGIIIEEVALHGAPHRAE